MQYNTPDPLAKLSAFFNQMILSDWIQTTLMIQVPYCLGHQDGVRVVEDRFDISRYLPSSTSICGIVLVGGGGGGEQREEDSWNPI